MASLEAIEEMIAVASFPQAPTTIGTPTHPISEHLGSLAWCFLDLVVNNPASNRVIGFSCEVIDTSNAVFLPKNQLGSRMSAGRVLLWS